MNASTTDPVPGGKLLWRCIFRVGKMIQPLFWRKPWKKGDFAMTISQMRKELLQLQGAVFLP